MPYTNVWSSVIPAGTELARNIDDHIRQLRLDLAERMVDLVDDWTADPIVPKPIWLGKVDGKQLLVPFSKGILDTSASLDLPADGSHLIQTSNASFILPLELPLGITITQVEVLADRLTNAFLTWRLYRKSFSGAAAVQIEEVIHNIAGPVISDLAAPIVEVVAATDYYYIHVLGSAQTRHLYAARITYNAPDSRNTI